MGEGPLLCLDWQHRCYRVWPTLIRPENLDPPGRPGWPLSPYPDGDYHIYPSEGFRSGSFGHPWESSLCIFGPELLDAIAVDVHAVLRHVIRRDGRPTTA
ncbi:DUF2716 domain-containing protein [Micromonospora endolithica]|uniref:DUF2716 domain-containing protein n=1 Tax=Micromonospora endolithica TaxID=230091 RepID=UPI0011AC9721|nr:DUF2716 domain-containing protein [Micromonospora endolithica]TWJ22448.1 uncharacterized protein DUF2716 [Micromonospora endolithica]